MEHASHLVDILDKQGKVIDQKKRLAINKQLDIYHAVYAFLITPRGELVLSVIPPREDLPNLYTRQFGATVASIRRHKETALTAIQRALSREAFIDQADVQLLGESMLELSDSRYTYASVFSLVAEAPSMFSVIDIDTLAVVNPSTLNNLILHHPYRVAPTLQAVWKLYKGKLPI